MSGDDVGEFGFGRPISAESREALGLASNESVRVLARGGRTLLLERGEDRGRYTSWGCDLALSADVGVFALADALCLIHSGRESGLLHFQFENEIKSVYFDRGEVVFAESNLSTDRLGASLLRSGAIDQAQLDLAERRYHPGTRFGKVVVEQGLLTPRALWNGMKLHVEEIVRSLFTYTGGWIHFWSGAIEPDNVVRLSLPTARLIDEGLADCETLLAFVESLTRDKTRIAVGRETRTPASENERSVMQALATEQTFSGVCEASGLDARTAARTLQFLQLTGHVELCAPGVEATADPAGASDEDVRHSLGCYCKLIGELTAPLVAIDGSAAVAARLDRIVEESAENGRRLLAGIRCGPTASLDPEVLAPAAIAQPGDRLQAVGEAMEEIAAYLEFELKNHPEIDDAQSYLEAVRPLRAMLEG